MKIRLTLDSTEAIAELHPQSVPYTCAALAEIQPITTPVHYAKMAGQSFHGPIPLCIDKERHGNPGELAEGTVAYWAERQLFCIYYGKIQDTDFPGTLLGNVVENLAGLVEAGEEVRRQQGRHLSRMHVELAEPPAGLPSAPRCVPSTEDSPLAGQIMDAYRAIWDDRPEDVEALVGREGIMRPAGPLLSGEGDSRKLLETLWVVREEIRSGGEVPGLAVSILDEFVRRLGRWYGLKDAAAVVQEAARALPGLSRDEAVAVTEALCLYVGRVYLWLDAHIPWNDFNQWFHEGAPHAASDG